MIIQTSHLLAGPLVMLIWTIDIFIFLVGIRWFLAKARSSLAVQVRSGIQALSDPLPTVVGAWLAKTMHRAAPRWLPWVIVVTGAITIRQLLAVAVLAMT